MAIYFLIKTYNTKINIYKVRTSCPLNNGKQLVVSSLSLREKCFVSQVPLSWNICKSICDARWWWDNVNILNFATALILITYFATIVNNITYRENSSSGLCRRVPYHLKGFSSEMGITKVNITSYVS